MWCLILVQFFFPDELTCSGSDIVIFCRFFSGPLSVGIEKYSRFLNFRLWESIGTSPNATCTLVNKALLKGLSNSPPSSLEALFLGISVALIHEPRFHTPGDFFLCQGEKMTSLPQWLKRGVKGGKLRPGGKTPPKNGSSNWKSSAVTRNFLKLIIPNW